jgi:uncharacterized OsmC-like protein
MALEQVKTAMQRLRRVLERRPDHGLHDDSPATARWVKGTRIEATHANGSKVLTDMPTELGGSGDQVTPGWMFRAGIASCTATLVAMKAAEEGIVLTALEVKVASRSDSRGMLGMPESSGAIVSAAPRDMELHVRIAASGVSAQRLREMVADATRCSPMCSALEDPIAVRVEAEAEAA